MKILVTGGSGFIGSNLISSLIKNNKNYITCIDNFTSSTKNNIKEFLDHKNFNFIKQDVIDKINGKYDIIYNLACPASPVHYQKDPIKTFKTSIFGSYNVLNNAYKNNSIVFQASTSEVYGDPLVHPQNEQYNGNVVMNGPRSCYDEGKRGAETIFYDYNRVYGVKIKVARIFNTYGPKMAINDGRVISNFIVQCLKEKKITIYGNGSQTRSFCYIDDLIDAIIMFSTSTNKSFLGPLNLGNSIEYSIYELARRIKNKTNSSSKIVFKNLPIDDPKKRKPDLKLLKSKFKWKAKTNLDQGLSRTIKYFREIIK